MPSSQAQLYQQSALCWGSKYIVTLSDSILFANVNQIGGKPVIPLGVPGCLAADVLHGQIPALREIAGEGLCGVIYMIGSNNIGTGEYTNLQADIRATIEAVLALLPVDRVSVCSPPSTADPNTAHLYAAMNAEFAALCGPLGVTMVNTSSLLSIADGSPPVGDPANYLDGVHLSAIGWRKLLAYFDSIIVRW